MGNSLRTITFEASTEAVRRKIVASLACELWNKMSRYALLVDTPIGDVCVPLSFNVRVDNAEYLITDPTHPALLESLKEVVWTALTARNRLYPARGDTLLWLRSPPIQVDTTYFILNLTSGPRVEEYQELPVQKSLSPRIARILVRDLLTRSTPEEAECSITYDRFSELDRVCVGVCGHVFSEAVNQQVQCPLCREQTSWTTVETSGI